MDHDVIACCMKTFAALYVIFWSAGFYGEYKKYGKITSNTWITFAVDFVLFIGFWLYIHAYGEDTGLFHFYMNKYQGEFQLGMI